MKSMRSLILFCLLTSTASSTYAEAPQRTPEKKTVKVLTIGNSFAQNACKFLVQIGENQGVNIVIGTANIGGCSLEKHARLARESETDPNVKPYSTKKDGKSVKMNLQEALTSDDWDYVTIQQFSLHSYRTETFHPHIGELVARIHTLAPQAKILVHETWAYRPDHSEFAKGNLDQASMYEKLKQCYADAAREFNATLIPVGTAFQIVRQTDGHQVVVPDPNFDYKQAVYPNIPNQDHSLIVGWYWADDKGKKTLKQDAKHANDDGCYLGGLVWYEVLTGGDAREVTFAPKTVDSKDAELYRSTAHEAVTQRLSR